MPVDGTAKVKRYARLKNDLAAFHNRWDLMAKYFAPTRYGLSSGMTVTMGENIMQEIYDSTGHFAADLFGNFMSGKVLNRAEKWFTVGAGNPIVKDLDPVKEWLEESAERLREDYANSNFYVEATESIKDYGVFATGSVFGSERPELPYDPPAYGYRGSQFQCNPIGRYVITENVRGEVDGHKCEFKLTARATKDRWPKATLPDAIQRALDSNRDDQFDFLYDVEPRQEKDRFRQYGNKRFPYSACYIEMKTGQVMEEGGYKRFPYTVSRYGKRWGEMFGRGFGELALHDAQTLNAAKRMDLEAMALNIRKPMAVSNKAVTGKLMIKPAAVIPVNTQGKSIQDSIMTLPMGEPGQYAQIKEEELRLSIKQMFYVAQILQMLEIQKAEMTAYEFSQKLNLLYGLLGPVYNGLEAGSLKPRVELDFMRLYEEKVFSPPPDELLLAGGEISIHFQNPLSQAQRMGELDAIELAVMKLAPIVKFEMDTKGYSEAMDLIDFRKAGKKVFDVAGVAAVIIRNDDELAAIDDARTKKAEQDQAQEQILAATKAAQQVAPALQVIQGGKEKAA